MPCGEGSGEGDTAQTQEGSGMMLRLYRKIRWIIRLRIIKGFDTVWPEKYCWTFLVMWALDIVKWDEMASPGACNDYDGYYCGKCNPGLTVKD